MNGWKLIKNIATCGLILQKKRTDDVPKDQEMWRTVKDKLKHFSEKPGKGD